MVLMSIIIRPSLQDGDKNRGKPGPGVETPGYLWMVPSGPKTTPAANIYLT
jgi:hypothetical protein